MGAMKRIGTYTKEQNEKILSEYLAFDKMKEIALTSNISECYKLILHEEMNSAIFFKSRINKNNKKLKKQLNVIARKNGVEYLSLKKRKVIEDIKIIIHLIVMK